MCVEQRQEDCSVQWYFGTYDKLYREKEKKMAGQKHTFDTSLVYSFFFLCRYFFFKIGCARVTNSLLLLFFSFALLKFNYLRLFQRFSFYVFAKALNEQTHKTIGCCFTCFCCCDTFSTASYALTQCFSIHTLATQLMQKWICLAAYYSSRRTRTRTKFNGMIFGFLSTNSIARNEIRCVHSCSVWSFSFRWVESS